MIHSKVAETEEQKPYVQHIFPHDFRISKELKKRQIRAFSGSYNE